jgi:GNAT superfamily N-acetyltransferase
MEEVAIRLLHGEALGPWLGPLARLRLAVFRDWPYLYAGREADERAYLRRYAENPRALVVAAFAGDEPVGMASCLPLACESAAITAPFVAAGLDPGRFFYFAESVLLPPWRGRGLGVRFFATRESFARATSTAAFATFCAVCRPTGHPARPPGWAGLGTFWQHRGYRPEPRLCCALTWREPDGRMVEHVLSFWIKPLALRASPWTTGAGGEMLGR